MNKQELIGKIIDLPYEAGVVTDTLKINRAELIKLIDQFDEPQKITIPQFVADWIEYCKNTNVTLVRALLVENVELYNYANQKDYKKLKEFLKVKDNQEDFACAWLDGYEVAKDKRYIVKVKGAEEGYNYLNCRISLNEYFFSGESEPLGFRVKHTREMLEGAGFGWVFDCPGIEIEEAEE